MNESEFDGFDVICGLKREDLFWPDFFFNKERTLLQPCAEFSIVLFTHAFFLFNSVLALMSTGLSSHISSESIRLLLCFRLFTVIATVTVLLIDVGLVLVGSVKIPEILMFEHAIVAGIFIVYGLIWAKALKNNFWVKKRALVVSYNFCALTIFLMCYQRLRRYPLSDIRSFPFVFCSGCNILNVFLQLYEWKKSRTENPFEELTDNLSIYLDEDGDEGAGYFSRLFFCWVNPLIVKGYKGQLRTINNLFRLPPSLRVSHIEHVFFGNAPDELVDGERFSLTVGLFRAFGIQYFSLGILRLFADLSTFAGPVLLHLLIVALELGDHENMGLIYATAMMLCSFFSALSDFSFNFYMNKTALKVRCATLIALYDKLLTLPQHQLSNFSSGQLINFMSTDVDRIVNFVTSFHSFWSMPVNICIALYLLYREMGYAFGSGLLCAILMIPLNNYIATKIGKMSNKLMHYKDQRLKLVQEVIRSMKTVKLSNWEPFFYNKINKLREKELKYLRMRKYLDAVCVYLWASAPLLITITILTTYTLIMKEQLTAAKVFTSLALVNILIMPLNAFPWVLNSLIEANVSKKRLDKFFNLTAIPLQSIYSLTDSVDQVLVLDEANFEWANGFSVGPLSFEGKKGMVIGVSGGVASGKSTFLQGILGETVVPQDVQTSVNGVPLKTSLRIRQTTVHEGFAYVGQENWARRGTIRDNILCGSPMNEQFYKQVLDASALTKDIQQMPGGDLYEIGDEGSTLSGGQRARLALARAIYHENDIYLLDDPFASIDRKVGLHIWKHAIEGILKKQNRLVVVATHNQEFLKRADLLIKLDAFGKVEEQIVPEKTELEEPSPSSSTTTPPKKESVPMMELIDYVNPVSIENEEMERGTVKSDVYWFYLSAVGFGFAALIGGSLLAMQVSKNLADAWLSKWTLNTTQNSTLHADQIFLNDEREVFPMEQTEDYNQAIYFLTVYMIIAGVNTIFTLLRAFLFAKGGVIAAKNMHESLLSRVFTASISWWDATPWGRVVNRLCSDVYMADDALPFQLNICLASLLNFCGSLILTVFALPFLIPVVLILLLVYYFIQKYYRYTTCEVKRITSLTLSPLYGHITDTVTGLVTLRAFRFTSRFMEKLRNLLQDNLSAQYTNIAASQWLSIRLRLMAVVMVTAIAFTAVFENKIMSVESGLIGLSITYALTMTNVFNSLLSSMIDTEKELVSVERIMDYVETIPSEETDKEAELVDRFLYCRTAKGQIDFVGVCLRYASNLPLALRQVTFHVDAGKRVAIIGRTGAGKTSIFQSLLRAHPIESGKIKIDDSIDIHDLDPKAVRSLFGVINQTPFIFSGTVRENIKLNNDQATDEEILDLIQVAGLNDWLGRCGGLDAEVIEGGANFSHGERQIIQVCRLVLSKPKIVLIDEATAHMDDESHLVMSKLIRNRLETATVISIVHRFKGLEEYDWVIEMENGTITSEGPPSQYT